MSAADSTSWSRERHPEWFVWQGDQGLLPKDDVKRQLELFGNKVLPRYASDSARVVE